MERKVKSLLEELWQEGADGMSLRKKTMQFLLRNCDNENWLCYIGPTIQSP